MSEPNLDELHPNTLCRPRRNKLPLWLKIAFTAFVGLMVPVYTKLYGPWNFLSFCDVAVLVTCVGIWLESPLLLSMQAIAILVPQIFWIADFTGHLLGHPGAGMTSYMFWPETPVIAFEISLFHIWLPVLLLWLVQKVGYDRRAILLQIPTGISLILVCHFCFVPPDTHNSTKPGLNLNFVFGLPGYDVWPAHHPRLWLADMLMGITLGFYLPTHLVLSKTLGKRRVRMAEPSPLTPPQPNAQLLPDATLSR